MAQMMTHSDTRIRFAAGDSPFFSGITTYSVKAPVSGAFFCPPSARAEDINNG
ncbi:hypothetical protein GCM10009413_03210 [Tatumella punctata]